MDGMKGQTFFFDGIHNLGERWLQIIVNDGKYFE